MQAGAVGEVRDPAARVRVLAEDDGALVAAGEGGDDLVADVARGGPGADRTASLDCGMP